MEKKRKSRAIPGAKKGGSKPREALPVRTRLTVHVNEVEAEAVRAAAKAAGLSESAWLRRAVQEALGLAQLRRAVDATRGEPTGTDHARQYEAHLVAVGGLAGAD